MKKRDDPIKEELERLYKVTYMLQAEGHSDTECRYLEIVATILLIILDNLRTIRKAAFFFVGSFFGLLLSRLLDAVLLALGQ